MPWWASAARLSDRPSWNWGCAFADPQNPINLSPHCHLGHHGRTLLAVLGGSDGFCHETFSLCQIAPGSIGWSRRRAWPPPLSPSRHPCCCCRSSALLPSRRPPGARFPLIKRYEGSASHRLMPRPSTPSSCCSASSKLGDNGQALRCRPRRSKKPPHQAALHLAPAAAQLARGVPQLRGRPSPPKGFTVLFSARARTSADRSSAPRWIACSIRRPARCRTTGAVRRSPSTCRASRATSPPFCAAGRRRLHRSLCRGRGGRRLPADQDRAAVLLDVVETKPMDFRRW